MLTLQLKKGSGCMSAKVDLGFVDSPSQVVHVLNRKARAVEGSQGWLQGVRLL